MASLGKLIILVKLSQANWVECASNMGQKCFYYSMFNGFTLKSEPII